MTLPVEIQGLPPDPGRLTYSELLTYLENSVKMDLMLLERVEILESCLIQLYDAWKEESHFILMEAWKARMDLMHVNKKTPYKKLLDLEEMLKGFIAYHEKNPHLEKKKQASKYD